MYPADQGGPATGEQRLRDEDRRISDELSEHQPYPSTAERMRALTEICSQAAQRPGLGPRNGGDVGADAVRQFPVMHRELVRDRFEATVTDLAVKYSDVATHFVDRPADYFMGRVQVFLSGGGSGDLAYFLHDKTMWRQFCADFKRHFRVCGAMPMDRIAFLGTSDPRHTLTRLAERFPPDNRCIIGLQDGLEAAVRALNAFQPSVLCGFSSAVAMLIDEADRKRLRIGPRRVLTNTDALSPRVRADLTRLWRTEVHEMIASSELGVIAYECPAHSMHLNDRALHVTAHDNGASPGARYTSLVNRIQPIVNYALPLEVTIRSIECVCSSPDPVVDIRGGRQIAPLHLSGATGSYAIHPIAFRSALDSLPGLVRCDITVASPSELRLSVVGNVDTVAVKRAVSAALARLGVSGIAVDVERTENHN